MMTKKTVFRDLGTSDLRVSPIGLGCWQFSKHIGMVGRFWPALSDQQTNEIVNVSVQHGINWFDTAESYGWGASERSLASAIRSLQLDTDRLIIATKWWPLFRTAASISKTINQRIDALDGLEIDLYQIHQPFSFSSLTAQMKVMAGLASTNKIKYIGISNFSAKQMRISAEVLKEHGLPLVANQVNYSLLDRRIEQNGVLETARELNIAIIAYSPLAQGVLSGKFHKDPNLLKQVKGIRHWLPAFRKNSLHKSQELIDVLQKIAEKYDKTISQIALNWTINFHNELVFAIPGASNPKQALENAEAQQFQMDRQDLELIDSASQHI